MKAQNYFFVLLLSVIGLPVNAQLSIGVQVGVNHSWRMIQENSNLGNIPIPTPELGPRFEKYNNGSRAIQLSGLIHYKLNENFTAGFEPAFASRGTSYKSSISSSFGYNHVERLRYASFPMMIIARFPLKKYQLIPFGKIGFGASFLTYGTVQRKSYSSTEWKDNSEEAIDLGELNTYDTGFYTGIGLRYEKGPFDLFTELNYYHGLLDVDPTTSSKNRSLFFGFGFLYELPEQ